MTEPQFDAPPENVENVENTENASEAPTTDAPRRGRGRPRTRETMDRDEAVIKALESGPKSREQLATELNQPASLVYLALWRLSHRNPPVVAKSTDGGVRHAWHLV